MKHRRKIIYFILFLVFSVGVFYISTYRVTANIHEVDPGRFYRSAQLNGEELRKFVEEKKIRTVISLRGKPENFSWMQQQEEVLKQANVRFKWFWWTSNYLPHRDELVAFLEALRTEEYPILIHCRSGADRTGEAAAIYAMDFMGEPREVAVHKHLSWSFWHIDWMRPAKKHLVQIYQGYEWAKNQYDPCTPENLAFTEKGQCPPKL
jgi:protein tyrosine phosphatase (PTP) superfamily phosphohydrolase (DUF442 family)